MTVALAARYAARVNPFLAPKPRPLIVGHRGVPALHQENTLAGFRHAVALGLDAIELDVRLTRDRRAIVFHDAGAGMRWLECLGGAPRVHAAAADHTAVREGTVHRLRAAGLAVGAHVVFPLGGRPTSDA